MLYDWTTTPARMLTHAWDRIARMGDDAPRLATLATVTPDHRAAARMVVIRDSDRKLGRIDIHTDSASAKLAGITANPFATLLIWDAPCALQIRATVEVAVLTGPQVAPQWQAIPEDARQVYGGNPAPSVPIMDPSEWIARPDPARFAVLACVVTTIDLVWIGPDRHRRAVYARKTGFQGQWVAP